jgi:hypothetical protein
MDRGEMDRLVQRLVDDPHDREAIAEAHAAGESDPKSYAAFLERVGMATRDRANAAHWLSEAANVWSKALGDAHRAARVLMLALERDPTSSVATERLAALYRAKGDSRALVALLDRRAKALAPLAADSEVRAELAPLYEEIARLWSEPPLAQPRKAIENYERAFTLDRQNAFAIFSARELYKKLEQWAEAIPLYRAELELEQDPARRVSLLRDEAVTRRLSGDLAGATQALARARAIEPSDPALQQEYATSVLERLQASEAVPARERSEAATLFTDLAEAYKASHGLAFTGAALDIDPGHDRALAFLLARPHAESSPAELATRCRAYLAANPSGALIEKATKHCAENAPAADEADVDSMVATARKLPRPESIRSREPEEDSRVTLHLDGKPGPPAPKPSADAPAIAPRKGSLEEADALAARGKKAEAFAIYKGILQQDPTQPEALAFIEDYLRSRREYAELRDWLLASVRGSAKSPELLETRKERLREVAGISEGNLRDVDGAIAAWRQLLALDRADDGARSALIRLFEKSQRWDDLANLIEQVAVTESDVETKVSLEKKLAKLQEEKRSDLVAAGEAWSRIARLLADDDRAITTAAQLFERANRLDLAAGVIAEGSASIVDPLARGKLLEHLGHLREKLQQPILAGDALAEAAEALRSVKLWEEAERLYAGSEAWEKAASAATQRGTLAGESKLSAASFGRAAGYFARANRPTEELAKLEEATSLDPLNDEYASQLVARYESQGAADSIVAFLATRGDRLTDRAKRVRVRREAAKLCAARLGDRERARDLWLKLLEDGDDREALERLIDDALERADHTEAATLLRRLGQATHDKTERVRVALREADILADGVGDIDTALVRYEFILSDLDATCRKAFQAIANIHESRGDRERACATLERELPLVTEPSERAALGARLAGLYRKLGDARSAIRSLDTVRVALPRDLKVLAELTELCEATEQWGRVAELLAARIEGEVVLRDIARMTLQLSFVLAEKLSRKDEALAVLTELATQGDATVRRAYVTLGDALGQTELVATKLYEWWFDARHGPERNAALRAAFDRFMVVRREREALTIAVELVRAKAADRELAAQLETLSVAARDEDALFAAHDVLVRDLQGAPRALELVRQAEVRARAGADAADALTHGERSLALLAPNEAEPLLERLAAIAPTPAQRVELYERQVQRAKLPSDRAHALLRAAQVAAANEAPERARACFDLLLHGVPSEELLALVETAAKEGDASSGSTTLRHALFDALSTSGHGARDGGKTRAALLKRAARLAEASLEDSERAFLALGDALVAQVEDETLCTLEALGEKTGDDGRVEAALTHALSEVFDGPLVRQLLMRRASLRRHKLRNLRSASEDLKRLHDLAPNDQATMNELAELYTELGDHQALVHLFEDQILRGKDVSTRADLAKRVAQIWELNIGDPREAVDAWRRVLRMRPGDPEATAALERTKSGEPTTPRANLDVQKVQILPQAEHAIAKDVDVEQTISDDDSEDEIVIEELSDDGLLISEEHEDAAPDTRAEKP